MTAAALTERWSIAEVVAAIDARLLPDRLRVTLAAEHVSDTLHAIGPPSISTRDLQPGALFVALQGTRTHGIEFARDAFERGAVAVLVGNDAPADRVAAAAEHGPVLACDVDGVIALGRLARAWRRRCGFTVVGITGSSGKTSTKDILAGLLRGVRTTVASHANNNNEIGVPLTLLGADADTDVVICEMGMRGLHQIEYLCDVAEPDVGLVTNVGTAHIELLGTTDNITRAKAEVLAGVAPGGTGVLPEWQPELLRAARRRPDHVLTFGRAEDDGADCRVAAFHRTADGVAGELELRRADGTLERHAFALPVHGAHQARNLAAAVCAYRAIVGSLDGLAEAFTRIELTAGRGNRHALRGGGVLIDDAYNANPESMAAAIGELVALPASRRVAVLGPMAELGEGAPAFHRQLGELVAEAGVRDLVVVATNDDAHELAAAFSAAAGTDARVFPSPEAAAAAHATWLAPGDAVLVKASNGVGLATLVQALLASEGVDDASGVQR